MSNTLTILSCDPAKKTFAYAVSTIRLDAPFAYKIHKVAMLENPVQELHGDVNKRGKLYLKELRSVIKEYKVDVFAAERYQARGLRGNTIEMVSVMLGLSLTLPVQDHTFITASQWKNAFNKTRFSLDVFYETAGVVPHKIDAACIGLYCGAKYLDATPFDFLESRADIKKLLQRIKDVEV